LGVSRGVAEKQPVARLEEEIIARDPISLEPVGPCADDLAGTV
jgi:hypothetical protein